MRGHDQSPARNDPDYVVMPPKNDRDDEFRVQLGSDGPVFKQPSISDIVAAASTDETTDNPEKHTAATYKEDIYKTCREIARHLKVKEVDPWWQAVVAAIQRTSAVFTLNYDGIEYLAIVEGNPMFPSPRSIRKSKHFTLALAWAFLGWLEQREQD